MQKRVAGNPIEPAIPSEESEFRDGRVVGYYDYGTRYGHIETTDVDDDGDLVCHIRPIGCKGGRPKRLVHFKSKELFLA